MVSDRALRQRSLIARQVAGVCLWIGIGIGIGIGASLCLGSSIHLSAQDTFSPGDAREVLKQVSSSLIAHNPRNMLAAFDITQMQDGTAFRQQTLSFFNETGIIRVHFNVLRAGIENGKAQAEASMEMEAEMRDDRLPVLYKQATLHLEFAKTSSGWRITAISPRNFFTTQS